MVDVGTTRDRSVHLDQRVRMDSDQTAYSRVKDFYMPIPARQSGKVASKKKPGSTITPREWQEMVQEAKGHRRHAEMQQAPAQSLWTAAKAEAEPSTEQPSTATRAHARG